MSHTATALTSTPIDHIRLFNAATEYDRRESKKAGHNPYALAHYARALTRIRLYTDAGHSLRDALITCTLGRFCDRLLKSVALPLMSKEESKWGLEDKLPRIDIPDDQE